MEDEEAAEGTEMGSVVLLLSAAEDPAAVALRPRRDTGEVLALGCCPPPPLWPTGLLSRVFRATSLLKSHLQRRKTFQTTVKGLLQ